MGFHVTYGQIDARNSRRACRFEHGIGLSHASGCPEKNLEAPTSRARFLVLYSGKQFVGIAALRVNHY